MLKGLQREDRRLSPQAVTTILHALATLHVTPGELARTDGRAGICALEGDDLSSMEGVPMYEVLAARLDEMPTHALAAQDVCNLAWAVAVLQVSCPLVRACI